MFQVPVYQVFIAVVAEHACQLNTRRFICNRVTRMFCVSVY